MKSSTIKKSGFSLTEVLITVSIVSILSSIALPNYTRSICKSDQAEAVSELTMLQTAAMSYTDEYGTTPTTWDQIGTIMPIQTISDSGTKTTASGSLNSTHILRSEKYELSGESNTNITTFSVKSIGGCSNYDAKACVNTQTGQSDIAKKDGNNAILTTTCA
ncbi:type IV pilin protein [Synechococcus sp. A15-60]|uniref:type IV pilin protein n=1 Tax=Synechococcus sp. A15-60 TaxID=1050655 RepID=UPI0016443718|nr:type II secretion system protein [Synechococcus sp. A15-60]